MNRFVTVSFVVAVAAFIAFGFVDNPNAAPASILGCAALTLILGIALVADERRNRGKKP